MFCLPLADAANIIDSIYDIGAGSFENPDPNLTNFATLEQGSTDITAWTVGQGSIDWVRSNIWTAADGSYSLDMNGTAPNETLRSNTSRPTTTPPCPSR